MTTTTQLRRTFKRVDTLRANLAAAEREELNLIRNYANEQGLKAMPRRETVRANLNHS